MRTLLLLQIFLGVLVLIASAANNSTKPTKKSFRTIRRLKKVSKPIKKSSKSQDQAKSASYNVPILVSSEDVSHVPVKLELYEDDRYIKSADLHPIEPIHLVNIDSPYHLQQASPVYIDSKDPHYKSYSPGGSHSEPAYHSSVAVPHDYSHVHHEDDSSYGSSIAPHNYYPEDYGDLSAIPGAPGVDYPTYALLPKTGFECLEHTSTPGFYADVETKCQMWHYCQPDGRHDRFLCPNGTVFDQLTRVCNWWFNVHCDSSLSLYDINFDLYREPAKKALSQSLDITPYHQGSSQPKSVDSAPDPNSFLRHVKDFEANLASHHHPQSLEDHRPYSEVGGDYYPRPIQSAASPRVHRYPAKTAPVPRVVHEYDNNAGPIDYDSSNAHTLSTPSEDLKFPLPEFKSKQKKQRIARRKLRRHNPPKIYSKHSDDDDIPTYREAKATPPPSRRYRVVRRRKVNKA